MHDRIQELAERLKSELVLFSQGIARMAGADRYEEGPGPFIERHMVSRLSYDLVFHDPAGNIIGILVGAEEGATVLLRSYAQSGGEDRGVTVRYDGGSMSGPASQIYAGHILGESGMIRRGTVVAACFCGEGPQADDGTRFLVEDTLPKLGIFPGMAIAAGQPPRAISGESLVPEAHESTGSEAEPDLLIPGRSAGDQGSGDILIDGCDIPVVRCSTAAGDTAGPADESRAGDDLVKTAVETAALLHGFLVADRNVW